jgi:hypothetical protein
MNSPPKSGLFSLKGGEVMKQAWSDLKSFLTIVMTLAMIAVLLFDIEVNQAVFALFSTSYGSMITFFFTKKPKEGVAENGNQEN